MPVSVRLVPPMEVDIEALAWGAKRARRAHENSQRGGHAPAPWTPDLVPHRRRRDSVGAHRPARRLPPLKARLLGKGLLNHARALLASASVSRLMEGPVLRDALQRCAAAQPSTSGCSYVVATESRQEGTCKAPLPGLSYRPLRPEMARPEGRPQPDALRSAAQDCLQRLEAGPQLLVVALPAKDESASRPYLLRPGCRSQIANCTGAEPTFPARLTDLASLMKERHMFCVLLRYVGGVEFLRPAVCAEESDIQLTLFIRRCQAGTATLRPLVSDLAQTYGSGSGSKMNVLPFTLGVKTETFVSRENLKTMTEAEQMKLLCFTHLFEERLALANAQESAERLQQLWRKIERDTGVQEAQAAVAKCFGLEENQHRRGAPTSAEMKAFAEDCPPEVASATLILACFFAHGKALSRNPGPGCGQFPWPMHMVDTRDSYSYELTTRDEDCFRGTRQGVRRSFHFPVGAVLPPNFGNFKQGEENLAVGATTYIGLFTDEELAEIEARVESISAESEEGMLPAECFETDYNGCHRRRTKMFFGFRYLWTQEQLEGLNANIAAGVRADVPPVPSFVRRRVEQPLVAAGVLDENFVNSCALNIYHDGSEGIQSHFDDSSRFCRPIVTLRLFSDSRLSFGGRLLGCCNGEFVIPMPRGCVTVLEPGSYAADGVKHAIKPMDMTWQSAAVILRKVRPEVCLAAESLACDDTVDWFRLLSLKDGALSHRAATRLREQEQIEQKQCSLVLESCLASVEREIKLQAACERVVQAAIATVCRAERQDLARQRVEDAATRQCQETIKKLVSIVAREAARGEAWRARWERSPYAPAELMSYERHKVWKTCAGVVRNAVWTVMRKEKQQFRHLNKDLHGLVRDMVRDVERDAYRDSNAVETLVGDIVATVSRQEDVRGNRKIKRREYLKRRRPKAWNLSPAEWTRLSRKEQDLWYQRHGKWDKPVKSGGVPSMKAIGPVPVEAFDIVVLQAGEGRKRKRRRPRNWPHSPADWLQLTEAEKDEYFFRYERIRKSEQARGMNKQGRAKASRHSQNSSAKELGLSEEEIQQIRLEARLEREALIRSCLPHAPEEDKCESGTLIDVAALVAQIIKAVTSRV